MCMQDLEQDRQIPLEDVVEYCHRINCPLIETSAKVNMCVVPFYILNTKHSL